MTSAADLDSSVRKSYSTRMDRHRVPIGDARLDSEGLSGPGLERFCVAICHDLRGPLATAGAAVDRLARQRGLPAPADDAALLEIARQSLRKADELLTTLPSLLAREARVALEAVALEDLVRAVRGDVALELELAGATLEVRSRLPVVRADRERLRIALRNLLGNAVQHRRAGVPLVVSIRAWRRGTRWTITLSDNGAGIARGERGRVFAPLERGAGAARPGSGLGLTLVRHAVEACGGSIGVSSRPGSGTSFAITLQAAEVPSQA